MKTKIFILSVLISIVTLTVASTQTAKQPKVVIKKSVSATQSRVHKGLAMEDRNQFN